MKLVVDTNRIIAALIKNSLSRQIINHPFLEFITPDYTI
jgi:predicted nucleic acid-binding protein